MSLDIVLWNWNSSKLSVIHGIYKHSCSLFLYYKYLPGIVESLSAAYKNYEEGRLLRVRRKMLRGQISNDPDVEMLSKSRKDQLTLVIDELLVRARRILPKASRFSRTYVRKISIRIMPSPESKPDEKKVKNNHDE